MTRMTVYLQTLIKLNYSTITFILYSPLMIHQQYQLSSPTLHEISLHKYWVLVLFVTLDKFIWQLHTPTLRWRQDLCLHVIAHPYHCCVSFPGYWKEQHTNNVISILLLSGSLTYWAVVEKPYWIYSLFIYISRHTVVCHVAKEAGASPWVYQQEDLKHNFHTCIASWPFQKGMHFLHYSYLPPRGCQTVNLD